MTEGTPSPPPPPPLPSPPFPLSLPLVTQQIHSPFQPKQSPSYIIVRFIIVIYCVHNFVFLYDCI